MADIPGIIEGAAEGKGLGLRFLRHIERNSVLLFIIPGDSEDVRKEWDILNEELRKHNPQLMHKEKILGISKKDLIDDEILSWIKPDLPDVPFVFFSSVTGEGLAELKDLVWKAVNS
jgi:GTP-binding protein